MNGSTSDIKFDWLRLIWMGANRQESLQACHISKLFDHLDTSR